MIFLKKQNNKGWACTQKQEKSQKSLRPEDVGWREEEKEGELESRIENEEVNELSRASESFRRIVLIK